MRRPGRLRRRVGVTLPGAALLAASLWGCGRSAPEEGTLIDVRIPRGASVRAIADRLEDGGLIDHPWWFAQYVRWKGADEELKAGHYRLLAGSSFEELVRILRAGEVVTHPLTIPEGLRLRDVAARIAAHTGEPHDSVRALLEDSTWVERFDLPGPTLEGYLFPETYRFAEGVDAETIVRTMIDRYEAFWGPEERARATALGLVEREVVTLASIVEEEAILDEERPIIAGVYLNRLEIGMPLQADPTVQYALPEPVERLLFRHIEAVADHPYNTYTHPGLPPGPIASPGEASLRATLEPAEHPFLFFVARTDGSHEFTRTLREHTNAVNRIRRERDGMP